jgi:hypothetical protein
MIRSSQWLIVSAGCFAMLTGEPRGAVNVEPRVQCTLRYDMDRWRTLHRLAEGRGTIRCDNGRQLYVTLTARGSRVSAGNAKVRDARGTFSPVSDIHELLGDYGGVMTRDGAPGFAPSDVVTKGGVALTLPAAAGWSLGITGGRFEIRMAARSMPW